MWRVDAELVRGLIVDQFPAWQAEPIAPIEPGGWDHVSFRIGTSGLARFPRAMHYAPQVDKEQRWLPVLGARLPLAVPEPLGRGRPGRGYPWEWSIYAWIEGNMPVDCHDVSLAEALASFLRALYALDTTDGPRPGLHNFFRGGPLAAYDGEVCDAIDRLGDRVGRVRALTVWSLALASTLEAPPVWVHGDITPGNLLVREGRLHAVIDFGGLAVGDPACDLTIAWTFFEGRAREAFRLAVGMDEGTWARARGWALWKALIRLARREDPADRRVLASILADGSSRSRA
ncbi:MAG: aminoglycoside phosphotransferase family protein [Myxococcota bacterium]